MMENSDLGAEEQEQKGFVFSFWFLYAPRISGCGYRTIQDHKMGSFGNFCCRAVLGVLEHERACDDKFRDAECCRAAIVSFPPVSIGPIKSSFFGFVYSMGVKFPGR